MRRMVDILLCPPLRERSPSFIYWEPNEKQERNVIRIPAEFSVFISNKDE